jgi:hypothetical protein
VIEGHSIDIWERKYSYPASKEDYTEPTDAFEACRNRIRKLKQLLSDEFSCYYPKETGITTLDSKIMNPIDWWDAIMQRFPSFPGNLERIFSVAKGLITPDPNSLGDELIKALGCLKAWWDNRLIKRH